VKIAVVSYLATYGNAPLLCRGFAALGHDVRLIIRYRNVARNGDYGFGDEFPNWQADVPAELAQAREWIRHADRIVVMAMPSLTWLLPQLTDARIPGAIILSSSHLIAATGPMKREIAESGLNPVDWNNRQIAASGLAVFAMPDLAAYVTCADASPYFPPVLPVTFDPRRAKKLAWPILIAHSPGNESRHAWKGTAGIQAVFDQLNVDLAGRVECRVLPKMPHANLLAERKRHHIFVDQVHAPSPVAGYPDYLGGLGKSGIEAMAACCVVITSGGPFECGRIDGPPVAWAVPGALRTLIERYATCLEAIDQAGKLAEAWTWKYCMPAEVADRIEERIE